MLECRPRSPAYPHRALKKAALAETYRLLAREGPDGVTLRAIARQVGANAQCLVAPHCSEKRNAGHSARTGVPGTESRAWPYSEQTCSQALARNGELLCEAWSGKPAMRQLGLLVFIELDRRRWSEQPE
jgi:hypothetical protein